MEVQGAERVQRVQGFSRSRVLGGFMEVGRLSRFRRFRVFRKFQRFRTTIFAASIGMEVLTVILPGKVV